MPVCISKEYLERLIKEEDNIVRKAALKEYELCYFCKQCGKLMNIVDYLIGSVCKTCCDKNSQTVSTNMLAKIKERV